MLDTINVKAWDGNIALSGTDKDLVVIFYPGTRINPVKSTEAGMPIYDSCDYMKVIHPGEPTQVYDQPVRYQDKLRFKDKWDAYQSGQSQEVSGTPLSVLFPHRPEIIKTLLVQHITTVQQLANLTDTGVQNMMFGLNLRDAAQKYLSVASHGKEYHELTAKLEESQRQIKELTERMNAPAPVAAAPQSEEMASMRQQLAALTTLMTSQQQVVRRKPGRKPGWKRPQPEQQTSESAPAA